MPPGVEDWPAGPTGGIVRVWVVGESEVAGGVTVDLVRPVPALQEPVTPQLGVDAVPTVLNTRSRMETSVATWHSHMACSLSGLPHWQCRSSSSLPSQQSRRPSHRADFFTRKL